MPASSAEEVRPSAEAQPKPPAPSGVVLVDTPTQRELTWIVDVLGRRHGVINTAEIAQHWDPSKLHGPVAIQSLIEGFRRWGTDTTNAIVDKIEVDDPAYLRAYVTAGDKRWRVVLSLEPSSMKLDFLQWDVVRDAGTGNAQ